MKVKQVIVVRTRYPDGKGGFFKPRTGKLIAQGAHASMKVFFDRGATGFTWRVGKSSTEFDQENDPRNPGDRGLLIPLTAAMVAWVEGAFTKVCVQVDSEEALLGIVAKAETAGVPVALIEDAGRTEFHGVPTFTCCAIGPAEEEIINGISGELKLL